MLTLSHSSKKSYYHSYLNDHNIMNVSQTWIGINQLIGRSKRTCKPIVALPIVISFLQ